MSADNSGKITVGNWAVVWAIGLTGQLLWSVENAIFNTFAYQTAESNAPVVIQLMVALSAVATMVSTIVMGTWSDRMGTRRTFVAVGYVLWGVFTIGFGAVGFLPGAVTGVALVVADCLMSFAGSIGYDAGFGAWTTDISNERNRGKLCGALAAMPVLATIVGTGAFGVLIDGVKGSSFSGIGYFPFFVLIGAAVIVVGIASLFFVRDDPGLTPNQGTGLVAQFVAGCKDAYARSRGDLVWAFVALAAYFSAFYVYFPFTLPYLEHTLGLGLGTAGIIVAVGLSFATLLAIPASVFVNRGQHALVCLVAVALSVIGLLVFSMADASRLPILILGLFLSGGGYILILQALNAWLKNLYPSANRGQFEGVRLVFFVCLPMAIGPAIGAAVVNAFGKAIVIAGNEQRVPSAALFQITAGLYIATLVPLFFAVRHRRAGPDQLFE